MTDYKELFGWLCRYRADILHQKHLSMWKNGMYDPADKEPPVNEYVISEQRFSKKAWAVTAVVYRRERTARRPWSDRIVASRSKLSLQDAYKNACRQMIRKWELFGKGSTLEEAAFRLSVMFGKD